MTVKKKTILTTEDLIKFCKEQGFSNFSSKESGYQLAVKIPTIFEVEENVDENHRGMMKLKFRIFHTGINRNNSHVSREAAEKAMNTIADRPVLAAIHQLDDGSWDFEGHEMEIIKNDNGEEELRYIESQVGSFSSEPAFWEHDDKLNKDFVCAYAYISREYTKACEIIEAKNGTKNSCELFIDELAYNAKENYLDLIDFYVNGSTLLGSRKDGTEIREGMEGSRADIADFSVENNSVKFSKDEKLIEILDKLNKTLSDFNIDNSKKGGISMNHFEELLAKYGKTVEDITFEYEGMSDEELDNKFAEVFGEGETEPEDDSVVVENSDETEEVEVVEEEAGTAEVVEAVVENETFTRTYELSHDDLRCALTALLVPYEEADNAYYYISEVFDSYFVYESWCGGGTIYGQGYVKDEDTVSFEGERYELFRELLTASEKAELEAMRSNYAAISEKLKVYEDAEIEAKKVALLNAEDYDSIRDNEVFAELVKDHENISFEELQSKCDKILLDAVKSGKYSAVNSVDDTTKTSKKQFTNPTVKKAKPSRYGKLFAKENE